jgi:hypothetical protein
MKGQHSKEKCDNNTLCYPNGREVFEEEALISLAEGWRLEAPPTAEMLENSYYAGAFERIRTGKMTWNWAAVFGGIFWLISKKMLLCGLSFTMVNFSICLWVHFNFVDIITTFQNSIISYITIHLSWFLIIIEAVILGMFGDRFLFSCKRKLYRNIRILKQGDKSICDFKRLFMIFGAAFVFALFFMYSEHSFSFQNSPDSLVDWLYLTTWLFVDAMKRVFLYTAGLVWLGFLKIEREYWLLAKIGGSDVNKDKNGFGK